VNNLRLFALGDIFLWTKSRVDPFENMKGLFPNDALMFGNLETVLSNRGNSPEKRVSLRTDPGNICYLKNNGFNIVNIANNHIMDYGEEGLFDTIDILKKSNIRFIGAGRNIEEAVRSEIFNKHGLSIGFMGFTSVGIAAEEKSSGCAPLSKKLIIKCVSEVRKQVDILVVSLHWGIEYVFYPAPEQQKLARVLIDNGADLIIGHHPHVIQGIEEYRNKLIIYSLGNCNFGVEQDKNYEGADIGLIISVEFIKGRVENYELIPVKIDSNYRPAPVKGEKKLEILNFIEKISVPIQNEITSSFWFEEASTIYLSSQIESYLIRIKRYGRSHLFAFIRWLIAPFTLKMVLGWMKKHFKSLKT